MGVPPISRVCSLRMGRGGQEGARPGEASSHGTFPEIQPPSRSQVRASWRVVAWGIPRVGIPGPSNAIGQLRQYPSGNPVPFNATGQSGWSRGGRSCPARCHGAGGQSRGGPEVLRTSGCGPCGPPGVPRDSFHGKLCLHRRPDILQVPRTVPALSP
jgi:hypothetical protein